VILFCPKRRYINIFSVASPTQELAQFSGGQVIGYGGTVYHESGAGTGLFGSENFASVFGFVTGAGALDSMIGPPLAGYVFDRWHTYLPIWLAYVAMAAISALIILTTQPLIKTSESTARLKSLV